MTFRQATTAMVIPAAAATEGLVLGARQYDGLNQYYCPTVKAPGKDCANYTCLRRKTGKKDRKNGRAPVVVGPEAEQYECYDPETGVTTPPRVWNPIYDAGTVPPGRSPAQACDAYDLASDGKGGKHCGGCHWSLIILLTAAAIVAALIYGHVAKSLRQGGYHLHGGRIIPTYAPPSKGVAWPGPGGKCTWNGRAKPRARAIPTRHGEGKRRSASDLAGNPVLRTVGWM